MTGRSEDAVTAARRTGWVGLRGAGLQLAWTLTVLVLLLVAWNRFAVGYAPETRALTRDDDVFIRASTDLHRTLHELPSPRAPRVAIFGSSQIAIVKNNEGSFEVSMPFQLSEALQERRIPHEVVDFSAGGQQLLESMVVLLAAGEVARPRVVLVGVSLFSMMRTDVRPTLLQAIDVAAARRELLADLPPDLDREQVASLLAFTNAAPQRVESRGKTIQQRIDQRIGVWLDSHLSMVANRQVMFNELVDTPLRRDLVAFVNRNLEASRTARTYRIGTAYRPSLAALEVMGRWCRRRNVAFVVALLPFDHERPPVPFEPETERRLRGDLAERAERDGFEVVDFSSLLGSEHFGSFVDGSPDNLHFDAGGHERLGRLLAEPLAPLLAGRTATTRAGSRPAS